MAKRAHVLIVDDEPSSVDALVETLAAHYDVSTASSGEQAIRMCELQPPDLVLLDIVMPRVDGYEVCSRLKNSDETRMIPVLFVTARHSVEDQIRGLNAGAIDFLTKPVHEGVVLARVKAHVALKQQADFMREQALTDPLTGVANRRAFEERIASEWGRCRRSRLPIAMIMIDLDHFKQYNDSYGHVAGDRCLVQVATALKLGIRRGADLFCRFGGEEFAALMPESALAPAIDRARQLARSVNQLKIPHLHSAAANRVTVSCGVAALIPGADNEPHDLVRQADAMLYAAKRDGRNRTMPEPPVETAAAATG